MCQSKNAECLYTIVDRRTLKKERLAREKLQRYNSDAKIISNLTSKPERIGKKSPDPSSPISQPVAKLLKVEVATPPSQDIPTKPLPNLVNFQPSSLLPSVESAHAFRLRNVALNDFTSLLGSRRGPADARFMDDEAVRSYNPLLNESVDGLFIDAYGLGFRPSERELPITMDKKGGFRYVAGTSISAMHHEARVLFHEILGLCKFTNEIITTASHDKPVTTIPYTVVALPQRAHCDVLVNMFQENLNLSYYTLDIDDFKTNVVDYIYANPLQDDVIKKTKLYLVLAIGQLLLDFAQGDLKSSTSLTLFTSALRLRKSLPDEVDLWTIEVDYLTHFYYFVGYKKGTFWMYLHFAIKSALKLGLHRKADNERSPLKKHRRLLFQSLVMSDGINGCFISRPFNINYEEWDDMETSLQYDDLSRRLVAGEKLTFDEYNLGVKTLARVEFLRLAVIIVKICFAFYRSEVVSIDHAREYSSQLKDWASQLPDLININGFMATAPNQQDNWHMIGLLQCGQMYGVMLLGRPFFAYRLLAKVKPEITIPEEDKAMVDVLAEAAIKSSLLDLAFLKYWCDLTSRLESVLLVDVTFGSCLVLGLHLLYEEIDGQPKVQDEYMAMLRLGWEILHKYSSVSPSADRLALIVHDMIDALVDKSNQKLDFDLLLTQMSLLSVHLSEIDEFQKEFVPDDTEFKLREGSEDPRRT